MGREEGQEGQVRQPAGLWNEGHFPEHVAEEDRVGSGRDSRLSVKTFVFQLSVVLPAASPVRQQGFWESWSSSSLRSTSPFLQQEGRVVVKEQGASLSWL